MAGEDDRERRGPRVATAEPRGAVEIDIEGPGRLGELVDAEPARDPGRGPDRGDPGRPAGAIPGRVASALRTLRATFGFGAAAPEAARNMADLLRSDLRDDVVSDEEARRIAGRDAAREREVRVAARVDVEVLARHGLAEAPAVGRQALRLPEPAVPVRPETLPAVVSTALRTQGETRIVPEWHMVRHLPGYLRSQIRSLGRTVFAPFTDTPIEEIQVLSTLSNPADHVKAVATWILRNGVRDDEAELRFGRVMPSYAAKTQIWNVEGCTFMVVKDFAGHYIYAWPGGRGTRLDGPGRPARIGRA